MGAWGWGGVGGGGYDKIIWVNFKVKGETDLMLESFTVSINGARL